MCPKVSRNSFVSNHGTRSVVIVLGTPNFAITLLMKSSATVLHLWFGTSTASAQRDAWSTIVNIYVYRFPDGLICSGLIMPNLQVSYNRYAGVCCIGGVTVTVSRFCMDSPHDRQYLSAWWARKLCVILILGRFVVPRVLSCAN